MSAHVHLNGEELLELALGSPAANAARRAEVDRCAVCADALDAQRAFVARARRSLAIEVDPQRAERVAAEVLARTTRTPLTVRATLPVWREFALNCVSRSRALRWLAAGIMIQLFALPVLAYLALNQSEPRSQPRSVADGAIAALPKAAPDAGALGSGAELRLAIRIARDNAIARTRFEIATLRLPADLMAARASSSVAELVSLRAEFLHGVVRVPRFSRPSSATGIDAALWTEILLDRFALGYGFAPELPPLLERVRADSASANAELDRHALIRAAGYGILSELDVSGAPTQAVYGAEWFRALERAIQGTPAASDPTVRRWIGWGRSAAAARGS